MERISVSLENKQIREIKGRLERILFERHEAGILHNSATWGDDIYYVITSGDTNRLAEIAKEDVIIQGNFGVLANDELRNMKNLAITYIVIIMSSLVRDMYLDEETAYSISDASILTVEDCKDVQSAINAMAASMFIFTEKIAQVNKNYNPLVRNTKNYIHKHFHEKIKVSGIAEKLGTSPSYLAQVFKASEKITIHDYIRREKIARAKNLIMYSDLTMQGISDYLGYASPSHFAREFRVEAGCSPSDFRSRVKEFSRDAL